MRNVEDLRALLFAELEALNGKPDQVDLDRARLKCLLADRIIDTMRIEVQFAAVMKGSMDVPFIEDQTDERSNDQGRRPSADRAVGSPKPEALSGVERAARLLASGPSPDHAWRRTRSSRS